MTSYSSLTVTWFDATDEYVTQSDITSDIKAIPMFTDTGTDEVNEANIVVIANNGDYVTSTSPKPIEAFDRIRIECTDLDGNEYDRVFEVINIKPGQTNEEGTVIELDCWGIEYYLNKVHYTKPHWFANSFDVAKDIIDIYNSNIRNNTQPDVSFHDVPYVPSLQHGNKLPNWNVNHYEYGLSEDTCFNRINDLYFKLGASVAAGGVREFYETLFKTGDVNEYGIGFAISGAGPADRSQPLKFIKNAQEISVAEQEGLISNPTGTNTLGWGSPIHGSLPLGHSKYASQQMQFRFRPVWQAGVEYLTDAKVRHDGFHWKALSDHTSALVSAEPGVTPGLWTIISKAGEYGSIYSYSEWTDDKARVWVNAGSNPSAVTGPTSGTGFDNKFTGTGAGMFDGNIVINDDTEDKKFARTYADVRIDYLTALFTDTNGQLDNWATDRSYDGTRNGFPRGFRVLVDQVAPTGDLIHRDKNFKWYGNTVTEWDGEEWVVLYDMSSDTDKFQVAVIEEGKVYEWKNSISHFDLISTDYANTGNDCFHQYFSLANVKGFDDETVTNEGFTKNVNSAIEVVYKLNSAILEPAADENYYKVGAWLCFAFPFPYSTYGSITEGVGGIYGGGQAVKGVGTPIKEPATFDSANMGYLSDGTVGMNQDKTEEYGACSALAFKIKFSDVGISGVEEGSIKGEDYKFACFAIDTNDNVFKHEFTVDFPKHWEEKELQLSGFQPYKGRTPYFVEAKHGNFANIIRPKDIEVRNVMEWRNVRFIVIQYLGSYDEFGRYSPHTGGEKTSIETLVWNAGALISPGRTQTLTIDNLRFTKQLLARAAKIDGTDANTPDRNMEADFLVKPNISTYDQLLSEVKSEQEIQKFRHKEYNLTTTGTSAFDILFADSFYFQNDRLVSDGDDGLSNTIKLVAKRIEYSITKPTAGNGGLRRRITGIKRFEV